MMKTLQLNRILCLSFIGGSIVLLRVIPSHVINVIFYVNQRKVWWNICLFVEVLNVEFLMVEIVIVR